jgi:hypothetical protein
MRALVITLLFVAPLSAQQPASDAIPRELAVALLGGSRGDQPAPNIIVGRAPASLSPNLLPTSANILGGIEHAFGTTVVLRAADSPDSARASLVRHFERSGWRLVERERGHGFVPSASEVPQTFCRDNAGLSLAVRQRSQGGSLATVSSWSVPERGPCDESERLRRGGLERPELPTLEAPSGVRMLGSGMGGGREAREAFTRLESSMRSADIAAHYARQLGTAGWTVSDPSTGQGFVVYGVRQRDGENRALAGILLVLDIPESQQREVYLRVAREERRR